MSSTRLFRSTQAAKSRVSLTSWLALASPAVCRHSRSLCASWNVSLTKATSPAQTHCSKMSATNFRASKMPSTNFFKRSQTPIRNPMKRTYTPMKPKKILIVDDDEVVTNSYQNKLQSERFKVAVARNGEEALQSLAKEPVDLMILDFSLPGMNGSKILKTIPSQFDAETLPIIVFTNSYFPEVVKSASEAGATQCLRKSDYTPRQIVKIV